MAFLGGPYRDGVRAMNTISGFERSLVSVAQYISADASNLRSTNMRVSRSECARTFYQPHTVLLKLVLGWALTWASVDRHATVVSSGRKGDDARKGMPSGNVPATAKGQCCTRTHECLNHCQHLSKSRVSGLCLLDLRNEPICRSGTTTGTKRGGISADHCSYRGEKIDVECTKPARQSSSLPCIVRQSSTLPMPCYLVSHLARRNVQSLTLD